MKTHFLKKFLLTIALILASHGLFAQPPGGPPPGGTTGTPPPDCWPAPCIPVDGGIGFLVLAGAALGGKKLYDAQKRKAEK
ncbi:MAG: hypothetical protein R2799_02150 [Crocinitomicaceae bacterium]